MSASDFSALLSAPARKTWLCGSITYLTGETISFSGEKAMAFTLNEGVSDGRLLGGAPAAACSLTLENGDGAFTDARAPFGAQVRVSLCAGEENSPLAVFTVRQIARSEGDARLILSGSDALGTAFEAAFTDDFSYPMTLSALAAAIANQAGFTLPGGFPNADQVISARPDWGEISLRQALAFAAGAAGCFAVIERTGELAFRRVWTGDAAPFSISPSATLARVYGEVAFGPLTGVQIGLHGAPRDAQPLLLQSESGPVSAANCLSMSGNPLFAYGESHTAPLAQGLLSALTGMKMVGARLTWRGDPALLLGARLRVEDTAGDATDTLITRQSLAYAKGFSMQSECAVALEQRAAGRLFTASGALNAAMLSGEINGALIRDGSVAAKSLVAGSITALQLAADSVTAGKIGAGAVTAAKIAAEAVTTGKIASGAVKTAQLSAEAVTAGKIAAEAVTAEKIAAGAVEADHLAASVIAAINARIGAADIDFAKVKDLLAGSAIIEKGVGGKLFIANLAVTEANMVSLSVGELLVQGQDGGFYALAVGADGQITTERKRVGNADVGDKALHGGQKLINGSITAETLNARDIFGDSAVIRQLIAQSLDVDTLFAREATLNQINALDIAGNQSIRLYVQRQEALNVYLRVTENGLEIGKAGDSAVFRADNRTLEVTNIKTERVGVARAMTQDAEWAWIASASGFSLKWVGGDD